MTETAKNIPESEMHRRVTAMPDGRYLIFYTFGKAESETDAERAAENDLDKQ